MSSDADQCPGRLLQQAAIYNNDELMESLLEGPELEHINSIPRTRLAAQHCTRQSPTTAMSVVSCCCLLEVC